MGAGFIDYVYSPLIFVIRTFLSGKSDYYLELRKTKGISNTVKVVETILGVLITLLLLAVVLPLLSSANPYFQKMVEGVWGFLNLENLLKILGFENIFIFLLRLIFFLVFIFLIPKALTLINKNSNYSLPFTLNSESLPLSIPRLVLTVVLLIFFITQLQFYFASDATLAGIGVSHSQRTREVFGQLTLVAGVILVLIYNARKRDMFGKTMNWILGVQGIFLTIMAYKSVFEYINAWGFTYKRLYGLTFATWIAGIFILFFINYKRDGPIAWFVKKTVIFSGVILILVNVINFDYLIYHFGRASTGQGVDYTYLSMLSPDSLSYKEQFLKLEEVTKKGDYSLNDYNNENPLIILHKIEVLQRKYSQFDLRTLNLLDFLEYQKIKSIDTEGLRSYYTSKLYPRY